MVKTMAVIADNQDLVSRTFKGATIICNSNSRVYDPFFWPLWALVRHVVHRHTCIQNTPTHKINYKTKLHISAKVTLVLLYPMPVVASPVDVSVDILI